MTSFEDRMVAIATVVVKVPKGFSLTTENIVELFKGLDIVKDTLALCGTGNLHSILPHHESGPSYPDVEQT